VNDTSFDHFREFCEAAVAGKPAAVACSPELGAAAMVIVKLGSESYRQGKVFHFDPRTLTVSDGSPEWAKQWEKMSADGVAAKQVPGWRAGATGSVLRPEEYQKLAGPWINGVDPSGRTAS
jgi:hypothetical protein